MRQGPASGDELDEVVASYLRALDRGEAPPRSEVLARHPELRAELEEFFASEDHAARVAAELSAAAPDPLPARGRLGDYELLGEIARGGMGVVYRARHVGLDRTVALKAVLGGRLASPAEVERFRREAKAVAALDSPGVVPIYDVDEVDGCHYFTMKLMEGGSLAEPLVPLGRDPRSAAALVEKIARAVHFAHVQGILHRDLKPANILLDSDGEPHLSDFGLAKPLTDEGSLTFSGQIIGTASYMAPEQASRREPVTAASDVYGIGAILYEILTARPPFRGSSSVETMQRVIADEPEQPRALNRLVPRDLESICLKCLEKSPRRRYATAEHVGDDLRRFLAGEPIVARPVGPMERSWRWCRRHPSPTAIGALLATIAVGSSAGAFWFSRQRDAALENLWEARLSQAQALALSGKPGQRWKALAAVREAAGLHRTLELRDAAAACLASSDIEVERRWPGCPPGTESVVFDPELKRYARGDRQGKVAVHDVEGDRELIVLAGPEAPALVRRFSADGRWLMVQYSRPEEAGEMWVWDWAGSVPRVKVSAVSADAVADFGPPGTAVAAVGGELRVLELDSGKEVRRLALGSRSTRLRASADGKKIAAALGEKLEVWDLESGKRVAELRCPAAVSSVSWHPDGRRIAYSSHTAVYLWDLEKQDVITAFRASESGGLLVAFNPAGDLLATWGWDGNLYLRGLSGVPLVSTPGIKLSLQFSADRRLLGSFRSGNDLGLWKVTPSGILSTLQGTGRPRGAFDVDPAGRLLASPAGDGLRLWDLGAGREIAWLRCGGVASARFRGQEGLVTSGTRGLLEWPLQAAEPPGGVIHLGPPRKLSSALPERTDLVSLSADGSHLVTRSRDGHTVLLDLEDSGRRVRELSYHHNVQWVALAPAADWIAAGPLHGTEVKAWDAASGEEVFRLPAPVSVITARVLFSPDGKHLLVSTDSEYTAWETGSWRLSRRFPRKDVAEIPGPMAFDPRGDVLALGTTLRNVQLVDFRSQRELVTLQSPERGSLDELGFSPDGSSLIAACVDGPVLVWDLRTLRRELDGMGLDWEAPPYPPPREGKDLLPLQVEVDMGGLPGGD